MVHRHPGPKQALSWEALSMVMSNHVLTGRGSYHRNLERVRLELTLFKLSHHKWKLTAPPSGDSMHHPAVPQARRRLLESLERQDSVNCEVGNMNLSLFLMKGSSAFLLWGLEALWGKHR